MMVMKEMEYVLHNSILLMVLIVVRLELVQLLDLKIRQQEILEED